MRSTERDQRALIARMGFTVESERTTRGSHKVLYLVGPQGQRAITTVNPSFGCPRTLKNMARDLRAVLQRRKP